MLVMTIIMMMVLLLTMIVKVVRVVIKIGLSWEFFFFLEQLYLSRVDDKWKNTQLTMKMMIKITMIISFVFIKIIIATCMKHVFLMKQRHAPVETSHLYAAIWQPRSLYVDSIDGCQLNGCALQLQLRVVFLIWDHWHHQSRSEIKNNIPLVTPIVSSYK